MDSIRDITMSIIKSSEDELQQFGQITKAWQLSGSDAEKLLGLEKEVTANNQLPSHTKRRLSLLIGIYESLHRLFQDTEQANVWVHKPNKAFNDDTALYLMLSDIEGIEKVNKYLSAQRN